MLKAEKEKLAEKLQKKVQEFNDQMTLLNQLLSQVKKE